MEPKKRTLLKASAMILSILLFSWSLCGCDINIRTGSQNDGAITNDTNTNHAQNSNSTPEEENRISDDENHDLVVKSLDINDYYKLYIEPYGALINIESWNSAEEIPVYMYFAMFREHINKTTSVAEREEKYGTNGDGWAYPVAEFEGYIQAYFNVPTEYLRSDESIYNSSNNTYHMSDGGGLPLFTKIENENDIEENENTVCITVHCSATKDFSNEVSIRKLTIQKVNDTFKYLNCTNE